MKKILSTAIAALAAGTLYAEEVNNNKLEQVVVTAHRMAMPLAKVGSSVTIVDAEAIAANGAPNIAGVLRTQPGISASISGGAGKQASIRVRGEEAYRTLVLIDGVKISDPTNTQIAPRIEHISSSNIERIEVLRGPQGMMYGADAGGVINVITKRADKALQGGISAEYGRYGSTFLAGDLRGQVGDFAYSLLASDDSVDGFNARPSDTLLKDEDGYDNTTLHGNFNYQLSNELSLGLVLRDVDADNQFDGCWGTENCANDFEQSLGKLTLAYDTENLSHSLSYLENNVERQQYADDLPTYGYEGKIQQTQYFGAVKLSDAQSITFGIDSEEQTDELNDREQDQIGYLVEYQGEVSEDISVSLGLRHDDNDAFGEHTTYRLTTAYWQQQAGGDVKYKASYGTGFRAPSLYELAYNQSPWAFAPATNKPLQEETSEGFDIGVEYYSNQGHSVELVYFYQEIDDAIEFDLLNYSGYVQQTGRSRSQGVELAGDYVISPAFSVLANATYNDSEDVDGERRVRRPLWVANLGIQGLFLADKLQLNLDVRASRGSVDNYGVELEDYETVNINVSYDVTPDIELYVRGENIFNKNYQEITDYNTASEAYYAGFRLRFDG